MQKKQVQETRVRLIDVANKAKVSRAAAGLVLLGSGAGRIRVGAEKAALIKRAAKELRFRPDTSAQMLRGKKSKLIGVLIDSYASSSRFQVISVAEEILAKKGYRIMVGQTHDNYKNLKSYVADFSSRRVDGIICVAHGYKEFDTSKDFKDFENVIFVGEPRERGLNFVDHDLKVGMEKIVRYLIKTGRKRIGHFLMSKSLAVAQRLEGHKEELARHNIEFDEKLIVHSNIPEKDDYLAAIKYLVRDQKVDAIIANDDIWGANLIKYMRELKIDVPERVAVVGCDNLDIAKISYPELTSIDVASADQGKIVAQMMLDMIAEKKQKLPRQIKVEPKLIIREST